MKTIDFRDKVSDPVITEVRAIKRQIVADHGGDLDSFFATIRQRQSQNPRLVKTTTGEADAGQPATAVDSKTEVSEKPKTESEARPQ